MQYGLRPVPQALGVSLSSEEPSGLGERTYPCWLQAVQNPFPRPPAEHIESGHMLCCVVGGPQNVCYGCVVPVCWCPKCFLLHSTVSALVCCFWPELIRLTCSSCDGKMHMLLYFSHIGSVCHIVFSTVCCLAVLLFLCVLYVSSFVLGCTTSPVSDVVNVLTFVL